MYGIFVQTAIFLSFILDFTWSESAVYCLELYPIVLARQALDSSF